MPDVHARSTARTRVADVGCGGGWSTIAMARAYPWRTSSGSTPTRHRSRTRARTPPATGVPARFEIRDARTPGRRGPSTSILVLEALHDMSRPGEVLQRFATRLPPGGTLLVADEKVAEHFHAPADDIERLMYGWSIVHCLPVSLAETPSAAIGTVIRSETVRRAGAGCGLCPGRRAARRWRLLPALSPRSRVIVRSLPAASPDVPSQRGERELWPLDPQVKSFVTLSTLKGRTTVMHLSSLAHLARRAVVACAATVAVIALSAPLAEAKQSDLAAAKKAARPSSSRSMSPRT